MFIGNALIFVPEIKLKFSYAYYKKIPQVKQDL